MEVCKIGERFNLVKGEYKLVLPAKRQGEVFVWIILCILKLYTVIFTNIFLQLHKLYLHIQNGCS